MTRNKFESFLESIRSPHTRRWPLAQGRVRAGCLGLLVLAGVPRGLLDAAHCKAAPSVFANPGATSPVLQPAQGSSPAMELTAQGFDLLARKDALTAEAVFRRAIEAQPELGAAHRGRGLALWHLGQARAGLRELTIATRLDPEDAEAHLAVGRLAWALSRESQSAEPAKSSIPTGNTEDRADSPPSAYQALALEELRKALSLRPNDAEIRLNLASAFLEIGRAQDAMAEAAEAVRLKPSASARLVLGQAFFAAGEEDKAESEFKGALALDPSSAGARLGLGQLRLRQRRLAEAEEEFRQAVDLAPESAPAYTALAQALIAAGHTEQARGLLEKATALDPADWRSAFQLATLLIESGEASRATNLFQQVSRQSPDFLPAREQLGLDRLRHGDLKAADAEAETLVANHPQAAEGHRLMALVLWRQRDYETSLAECALALDAEPDSAATQALQAIELWQLDRKKEAGAAFGRAAKTQPQLGSAEVFCRLVLCEARDIAAVQDFLRKSRWRITPHSP